MVLYPASVLSGKKPKAQQISPLPPRREFWHRFSQRPLLGLENNIWEFLTAWFSGKWDVQKLMVGGFLKNYNSSLQECASPGCGCGLINSAVYQKMITIADKQAERDRLLLFFAFQKPGSAGRNFFNLLCIERMFARCCYILCCCWMWKLLKPREQSAAVEQSRSRSSEQPSEPPVRPRPAHRLHSLHRYLGNVTGKPNRGGFSTSTCFPGFLTRSTKL